MLIAVRHPVTFWATGVSRPLSLRRLSLGVVRRAGFATKSLWVVRDVEDGLGGSMWPADSVNGWMQTESIENEDIVLFLTLAPTPQHAAPASQHASAALICITPSLPSLHSRPSSPSASRRHPTRTPALQLALCPPTPAQPPAAQFPPAASAQHRRTCLSRSATATATANTTPSTSTLSLSSLISAAAAYADADGVPVAVERAEGGADARHQLSGSREALMMGAGRATPPPPFDAPGNPGAGPGPGDSLTSLRSVGNGDGEDAGMVTVPQSLGRPSLEAAGEDGSGPAAAETPVGRRMSLSSGAGAGAGAGEKTLDSDDMSGNTSLASIMDASISTPETTFTVGHPPPDVSKDTPVPLSLALYIPGVPATTGRCEVGSYAAADSSVTTLTFTAAVIIIASVICACYYCRACDTCHSLIASVAGRASATAQPSAPTAFPHALADSLRFVEYAGKRTRRFSWMQLTIAEREMGLKAMQVAG
ncbi:hypothetical protein BU17DRAFT_71511 [Hysterangium stoloniferum]|nr:hypothetical protein BU17DRAFT_71511 [Hysterangium stoloniferum]